jgi:glycogen(starch) synthase
VSTPRRIAMTADAVGGVWTYALDLAQGLVAHGFQTTLVVCGPSPTAAQLRAAEAVCGLRMVDTGLPLDWTAGSRAEIAEAAAAIGDIARRAGADLVHLNSPSLAPELAFDGPVVGVCHSCVKTWWSAVKPGELPEDLAWRADMHGRGIAVCDAVVAPSAAFAKATATAYRVPLPSIVHNGRHQPMEAPPAARRPIVFTSGRLWDEGKNVVVLDAAAAKAGIDIFAAGPVSGPNGAALPALRNLSHLGPLSQAEIRNWLCRAGIYASSALYEPFGLGVLEAAQAGCALILSEIPTFRELWGGAAIFVDPRRPGEFAAAFECLLRSEREAAYLGDLARERARRFSLERMAAGTADIYAQALAAPEHARREAAA